MTAKIVIVSTGGTIASRFDPALGRVVASARGDDLLVALGDRTGLPEVTVDEFATVSSFEMTVDVAFDLARRINALGEREDVGGIVVTHGTDTLEETAFLLALLQQHAKPVVMTGAQLAGDDPQSDGPRNLRNAIIAAASRQLHGFGPCVGFNGELHLARYVAKTHSSALEAFGSPGVGPIGIVDRGQLHLNGVRRPKPLPGFKLAKLTQRVDLIKVQLGMDDVLARAAVAAGAKGLVIEGSGRGNVTAGIAGTLGSLARAGFPVVITSRCPAGRVEPIYGAQGGGGGKDLDDAGCIFAGDLQGLKARILLMAALESGASLQAIRSVFREVAP